MTAINLEKTGAQVISDEPTRLHSSKHRFTTYANPRQDIRADIEQWLAQWTLNYGDTATSWLIEQALQDFEPKVDNGLRATVRGMTTLLRGKEWAEQFPVDADAASLESEISSLLAAQPPVDGAQAAGQEDAS